MVRCRQESHRLWSPHHSLTWGHRERGKMVLNIFTVTQFLECTTIFNSQYCYFMRYSTVATSNNSLWVYATLIKMHHYHCYDIRCSEESSIESGTHNCHHETDSQSTCHCKQDHSIQTAGRQTSCDITWPTHWHHVTSHDPPTDIMWHHMTCPLTSCDITWPAHWHHVTSHDLPIDIMWSQAMLMKEDNTEYSGRWILLRERRILTLHHCKSCPRHPDNPARPQ